MRFISKKFATFVDTIAGQKFVIKSMDFCNDRKQVQCFREYLGYRLGRLLDLDIPPTVLIIHHLYGRISMQEYIDGCHRITPSEKDWLVHTPLGWRILVYDLLIWNHDRKSENILINSDRVLPIDFNVAFNFESRQSKYSKFKFIMTTWFGMSNLIRLKKSELFVFLNEVDHVKAIITDRILKSLLDSIDERFCDLFEKQRVLDGLISNKEMLSHFFQRFWKEVVLPDEYRKEVKSYYERRCEIWQYPA